MRALVPAVAALTLLVAHACAEPTQSDDAGVTVVATTTILGDVVRNVTGDNADVQVLMPSGADPHDFQASAAQIASLSGADLVVANGLGLEAALADVFSAAESDGIDVLEIGPLLRPIPTTSEKTGEEDHDREHRSDDPHVWMDPLRMAEAARLIAAELSEIAPGTDWIVAADRYHETLCAIDDDIITLLSVIPQEKRKLVTNHDSLGYFADRYGFEVIGTLIPGGSTLGEPSSEQLAELVRTVESEHVPAIFVDSTAPAALAEAIADEVGTEVAVVVLHTGSLGEPGSGADTLTGLLLDNAQRIASALGS